MAERRLPGDGAFPKEGAILYVSGMVVPKNAPDKEAAWKYVNALLEPSAQQGFAEHMGYLPTVDDATLTGKIAEQLAFPDPRAEAGAAGLRLHHQGAGGDAGLVEKERPACLNERANQAGGAARPARPGHAADAG